jgi:hypothetical protein
MNEETILESNAGQESLQTSAPLIPATGSPLSAIHHAALKSKNKIDFSAAKSIPYEIRVQRANELMRRRRASEQQSGDSTQTHSHE